MTEQDHSSSRGAGSADATATADGTPHPGINETATSDTAARMTPLTYRPALDGTRAIAVYLVMAFHAEIPQLAGGFLGVDVFFVLSGYLVTRVVFGGLVKGTFGIFEFYNRRIRRLLPAALVVLAVVTAAWYLVGSPVERGTILADVRSATLYYSNWHFAAQATDYFAAQNDPSPVLHFWSLSVEEQFYLFWPLLMLLGWRIGKGNLRRAPRVVFVMAAGLAVASLLTLWLTLHAGQTDLAYYGTHARVYQLLGGAALAVGIEFWRWGHPERRSGRAAPVLQFLALAVLLLLSVDLFNPDPSVRGVGAAAATLVLLWTLELRPTAPAGWLLSRDWLVYLGQISYGTYLWHYPVTLLIRRYTEMQPMMLFAVAVLLSSALAALSQRLLEIPIRKSPALSRTTRTVVATGLLASLLAGLLLFPTVLRSQAPVQIRPADAGSAAGALPDGQRVSMAGFDINAASALPAQSDAGGSGPKDTSCTKGSIDDCIVVRGAGKKVLLMGDSHALMLLPALRAIATRGGFTLAVAAFTGCPWQTGLVFSSSDKPGCTATKQHWYDAVIPQYRPDMIILVSRATDHTPGSEYSVESADPSVTGTNASELLISATTSTLKRLTARGQRVAVVEPVPVSKKHSLECLSGARFADECSFVTDGPSPAERAYRALHTTMPSVQAVDIDPLICPRLPVCDAVSSGTVVRKDHDHITARWSAFISEQLEATLRADGVL